MKIDRLLIISFDQTGEDVILCPESKPYQMKSIEKIADGIGVFAPILLLFFACVSYLCYPENEKSFPNQIRNEMEKEAKKNQTYNVFEPVNLYRD